MAEYIFLVYYHFCQTLGFSFHFLPHLRQKIDYSINKYRSIRWCFHVILANKKSWTLKGLHVQTSDVNIYWSKGYNKYHSPIKKIVRHVMLIKCARWKLSLISNMFYGLFYIFIIFLQLGMVQLHWLWCLVILNHQSQESICHVIETWFV